jgi:hypothetical protein
MPAASPLIATDQLRLSVAPMMDSADTSENAWKNNRLGLSPDFA